MKIKKIKLLQKMFYLNQPEIQSCSHLRNPVMPKIKNKTKIMTIATQPIGIR
jgi:hypothetical protein